jgi:chemotaxis methyl-accepting protein methylase
MFSELQPVMVTLPESRKRSVTTRAVPLYTALFRQLSNLIPALKEAHSRHANDSELRVISAACSIGAEADTILSFHNKTGHEGYINIAGIDINRRAIEVARSARYISRVFFSDNEEMLSEPVTALTSGGFDFSREYEGSRRENVRFKIDSAPVRKGHEVSFIEGDIVKDVLPPADLVLANNIMYHFTPGTAAAAVDNLASMVAPNGLLSIGGVTPSGRMGSLLNSNGPQYNDWLYETGNRLASDHGFSPLPTEVADVPLVTHPTIFARD